MSNHLDQNFEKPDTSGTYGHVKRGIGIIAARKCLMPIPGIDGGMVGRLSAYLRDLGTETEHEL